MNANVPMNVNPVVLLAIGVAALMLLAMLGIAMVVVRPWLRVMLSGGRASVLQILAMRLRGTPAMLVCDAYVSLLHAGEVVDLADVESLYLVHRGDIHSSQDLVERMRVK